MIAPAWQTDRAFRLHQAFAELWNAHEYEGASITAGIAAISARLDGTPLKDPRKPRTLKASIPTLNRLWATWKEGGRTATALLPGYKSPKHVTSMPDDLAFEIQRLATAKTGGRNKNQKGPDASGIHKLFTRRWKAGESLPGLGTWQDWWRATHPRLPLPHYAPDFPWSVKTVTRRMPPEAIAKMGNIGHAAALKHLPHMERDYSQLRKCELLTLDDVRLDLMGIDDLTGRVVSITCYILQDVGSRSILGFILKPTDAIKAQDVDELLAFCLQAEGFGIGTDYTTHIWFERGSVACSDAAQRVLEAGSDGAIQVHRTSMDGGISWIGTAADKASGHSAGKATIESFNRKLHNMLIHLPGQRGNNFANQPANLGVGDKDAKNPNKRTTDTQKAAAERLGQIRALALMKGHDAKLELPMLLVSQLQRTVRAALQEYNRERGHGMQGFHTIPEAEIAPGVWNPVGEPSRD